MGQEQKKMEEVDKVIKAERKLSGLCVDCGEPITGTAKNVCWSCHRERVKHFMNYGSTK